MPRSHWECQGPQCIDGSTPHRQFRHGHIVPCIIGSNGIVLLGRNFIKKTDLKKTTIQVEPIVADDPLLRTWLGSYLEALAWPHHLVEEDWRELTFRLNGFLAVVELAWLEKNKVGF